MPYYYDSNRVESTDGTGSTELQHLRMQTVANQKVAKIKAIHGSAQFGTAGGAKLRLKAASSIGSGGTAHTVSKRNPDSPSAGLTVFNAATALTAGTGTVVQRVAVGLAQTGGHGAWYALEEDAALALLPNGGANGNAELWSIANAASVPLDMTVEHSEG